jgi:hypothetical protein
LICSLFYFGIFNSNPQFERSFSLSAGPKAVLFHLAIFLLEALLPVHHHNSVFTTYNQMGKKYHTVGKVPKIQ